MSQPIFVAPPGTRIVLKPKRGLGARLALKVWRRVLRPLLAAAVVGGGAASWWLLRAVTVGRWRWQAAPLWLATVAALVSSAPVWGVVAAAVYASPVVHQRRVARRARRGRPVPRRLLSARESRLVSGVLCAVGTWWVLVAAVPGVGQVVDPRVVAAVLVLAAAPAWWWGRRVVPVAPPSTVLEQWGARVAASQRAGALAGTTLVEEAPGALVDTVEGPKGEALLALPEGTLPSHVERLDELAEHLLGAHPGTVNITRGVDVDQRHARVRFAPRGDATVFRFFSEPTLDESGRFVGGYAGDRPVFGSHWRENGAMNRAIVAGPGGGKQGMERLSMVEAALSPLVLPIVLDGKRGAGIPSVRDGAAFYAASEEQWSAAVGAVLRILRLRQERYGAMGWDSFTPGPGDPLVKVLGDEWRYIKARWPGLVQVLVEVTGLGRSLGVGVEIALQKGDAQSWGDAELRNNVYSNGDRWVGAAGDIGAAGVALQGEDLDLGSLPGEAGWAYWVCKVNGGAAAGEKARTLWIPADRDVEKGAEAPHGTVQQWMRDATFPALHPDEQAVLDALAGGDPELVAEARDIDADGRRVEGETKRDAVLTLLRERREQGEEPLYRSQIAAQVGCSLGYASDLLRKMADEGLVTSVGQQWEAAA